MIPVIIIDNNENDRNIFKNVLENIDLPFGVKMFFPAIKASLPWLNENILPGLVICELTGNGDDVKELIIKYGLTCPFIYTGYTHNSEYTYPGNAIGFIQKPVVMEEVYFAVNKYREIRNHFFKEFNKANATIPDRLAFKSRILVWKGQENAILKVDDVAYFFSDSRLTFVVDLNGGKYFIDDPLVKLQKMLDPGMFFRVSKKYLINLNAIKKFKILEKGRIELTLLPEPLETIMVSPYSAPEFKKWIAT